MTDNPGNTKVRIYDLAKKLNRTNKELIDVLNSMGIDSKVPSSSIPAETAQRVENFIKSKLTEVSKLDNNIEDKKVQAKPQQSQDKPQGQQNHNQNRNRNRNQDRPQGQNQGQGQTRNFNRDNRDSNPDFRKDGRDGRDNNFRRDNRDNRLTEPNRTIIIQHMKQRRPDVMGNIRNLRNSTGLTQAELAERTGVSEMTVRRWESGIREPRASEIQKLCEVFECDANELLKG